MELVYLQTFCEVVKWGSYSKAAEKLGYSQPSVTTQIKRLEESYGVVLLVRMGRGMKLTASGEALLPYAREMLRLHAESKEVVSQQGTGTMTIGTIETLAAYFLPAMLQQFQAKHPGITLSLLPGNEPSIIRAVKEGEQDFGFILDAPFTDPELVTRPIREEAFVIIAKPGHRFQSFSQVVAGDLAGESLILTESGCTYRAFLLELLKARDIPHRVHFEFGSIEAIKQCVLHGWGVALLPRFAVEGDLIRRDLVAVPFVDEALSFQTQLIYSNRRWMPKAFLSFIEMMVAESGTVL